MKRSTNSKDQIAGREQAPPVVPGQENALKPRREASPAKAATKITRTSGNVVTVQVAKSLDEMLKDLRTPTGTRSDEVAARIVQQVANSLQRGGAKDVDGLLIEAVSRIAEMEPQNLTEAMLATQTIATHEAATTFIRYGTRDGQTLDACNFYVFSAIRLMRLHLDQIEAMQKLKGKAGQQKVTVEHVHVHRGGQAIVGAVNAAKKEPWGE